MKAIEFGEERLSDIEGIARELWQDERDPRSSAYVRVLERPPVHWGRVCAWTVLPFVFTAALLGLVDKETKPAIEANTAETVQNALTEVLPADSYDQVEFPDGSVTLSNGTNVTVVAVYQAGEEGYVIEVLAPGGYGGDIDMMTGINAAGEVTGMSVISHAETSGLGSKATDPNWQSQFVGSTEDVSVTKDGGTINAITGSTITSRCVCNGVNAARAVVEALG